MGQVLRDREAYIKSDIRAFYVVLLCCHVIPHLNWYVSDCFFVRTTELFGVFALKWREIDSLFAYFACLIPYIACLLDCMPHTCDGVSGFFGRYGTLTV